MMFEPILCFGGRSRNMHHLFLGAGALYAEIGPVHGRALGQLCLKMDAERGRMSKSNVL